MVSKCTIKYLQRPPKIKHIMAEKWPKKSLQTGEKTGTDVQISHQDRVLLLYWRVEVGVASFNDVIDQLQNVQPSALATHALCCLFCFVPDGVWSKQQKALASYTPRFDDDDGEYCDGDGDDFDDVRGINMAALEGAWCPRHIWPLTFQHRNMLMSVNWVNEH